jgi:hypothetical protein
MAVANSTTQLMIPGLDASIQTNLNTVLNSNATVAAIQTNLNNAGSTTSLNTAITNASTAIATLPSREPYPNWGIWSNYGNSPRGTIYNSDNQKLYQFYQDTNSEMYANWTGYNYTNSNIGSNGWTNYWMGATPFYQADGHWFQNVAQGYANYCGKNPDAAESWFPFWGVIVGKSGVRQKFSLYSNGSTLGVGYRGIYNANAEQINLNNTTFSTWYGGTNYGMAGYNDRTNTLVVIEAKDGSNNYRMHVWVNTSVSLNSSNYLTGTLYNFVSQAKLGGSGKSYNYYDFAWNFNSSANYNESRYRMRVIVGDNNVIGLSRMVPSNQTQYATYTLSSSTLTNQTQIGLTTSYGIDNGNKYGMRHNITWDNQWVAAYSHYYYYGSGINVHFINTADPRTSFVGQNGDTNNGCQLIPYKSNKFIFNRSVENTDGNIGMRLYIVDPDGASRFGKQYSNASISNTGTINLTASQMNGTFDTYYTSTNYCSIMPVPHWRMGI